MSTMRSGYTINELIVVLVFSGMLTSLSLPRLHTLASSAALRSARGQTVSYLEQARALALQRGRETRFIRNGNEITVTVDSSGTAVIYGRPHNLQNEHGVSILASTTRDTIAFDSRGYAIGTGSLETIRLSRGGIRDSICVTRLGKVIEKGCSL